MSTRGLLIIIAVILLGVLGVFFVDARNQASGGTLIMGGSHDIANNVDNDIVHNIN